MPAVSSSLEVPNVSYANLLITQSYIPHLMRKPPHIREVCFPNKGSVLSQPPVRLSVIVQPLPQPSSAMRSHCAEIWRSSFEQCLPYHSQRSDCNLRPRRSAAVGVKPISYAGKSAVCMSVKKRCAVKSWQVMDREFRKRA